MQQSLLLNIIPFTAPVHQLTFPFYKEYKEGYSAIYIDTELSGLLDGKMTKLEQADTFWLYTDFQEPQEDAIILDIDLTLHTEFAGHNYRHLRIGSCPHESLYASIFASVKSCITF